MVCDHHRDDVPTGANNYHKRYRVGLRNSPIFRSGEHLITLLTSPTTRFLDDFLIASLSGTGWVCDVLVLDMHDGGSSGKEVSLLSSSKASLLDVFQGARLVTPEGD